MKSFIAIFKKAQLHFVAVSTDDDATVLVNSETSTLDSECSTLVDFGLDEVKDVPVPEDEPSDFLDNENMCWNKPVRRSKKASRRPRASTTSISSVTFQVAPRFAGTLLEEEESSWTMPSTRSRRSTPQPTRSQESKRMAKSVRRPAPVTQGELLEADERSWM